MNSIYFSSTDSYQAHGICQNKNNKIAHNVFQHLREADLGFFLSSYIISHRGKTTSIYVMTVSQLINK